MRVILVGGAGYIGIRLAEQLMKNHSVTIVDPIVTGYLEAPKNITKNLVVVDARKTRPTEKDVVVWLASPHKWGYDTRTMPSKMAELYHSLMVTEPARWARTARRFVYLSSMHALTGKPHCAYSFYKRQAETKLLQISHYDGTITILRPGTVYGDLAAGYPNRTTTVPNRWGVKGVLPDDKYMSAVTAMPHIVDTIKEAILRPISGGVLNVCAPILATRSRISNAPRTSFFRDGAVNSRLIENSSQTAFEGFYKKEL